MKKLICILLVCVFVLSAVLAGCSAKSGAGADVDYSYDLAPGMPSENGYEYGYSKDEVMSEAPTYDDGEYAGGVAAGLTERKRIQYVTVEMETLEYDDAVSRIKARTAAVGGYVESSRETGKSIYGSGSRRAELVLRIPTGELDGFTNGVSALGNVLSQYTTTNDVTDQYFDTEARLASLEMQRDKYMELLERAEDMVYIIELTNALTDVIYQIELYTGTLNKYDSLIAYSVVTVNISEVVELTREKDPDPTFGDRIAEAFSDSVEAFVEMCQFIVVALAASAPFLIIPAVLIVVIVVTVKVKSKKRRRAMEDAMRMQEANMKK